MKFAFRWFGPEDAVTLDNIRQIPCVSSIVTASYDNKPGDVWNTTIIEDLKKRIEATGFSLDVIEGLPVHEDIKLGNKNRDVYIQNYIENLRNLSAVGAKVVCYNFMPVFGWIRTDLNRRLDDGSTTLSYSQETLDKLDPASHSFKLPGWHFSSESDEIKKMIQQYIDMGTAGLWDNFKYFLEAIIPEAEKCNIKLAIHPDDPPLPLFNLPKIVSTAEDLRRITSIKESDFNGLTLCTGSLGANAKNDLVAIAKEFAEKDKIHFVHARNIKNEGGLDFLESGHMTHTGDLNMGGIIKALADNNFEGYIRSDHGRMIWGETGREGYGLYDRALGISYLAGLYEGLKL